MSMEAGMNKQQNKCQEVKERDEMKIKNEEDRMRVEK